MFKQDYYKQIRITSGFGVDRGNYKHTGVDYPGTKSDTIVSLIDGIVDTTDHSKKHYGIYCVIRSNPKFAGGVNELFYHSYCHLHSADTKEGDFIKAGEKIGLMGNTGNCYTSFNSAGQHTGRYRKITDSEKENPDCNFGVHLHLWFYQICKPGQKTRLLKDLMRLKIIEPRSLGDTHFYQWGKLIFAPRVIYTYFKAL